MGASMGDRWWFIIVVNCLGGLIIFRFLANGEVDALQDLIVELETDLSVVREQQSFMVSEYQGMKTAYDYVVETENDLAECEVQLVEAEDLWMEYSGQLIYYDSELLDCRLHLMFKHGEWWDERIEEWVLCKPGECE